MSRGRESGRRGETGESGEDRRLRRVEPGGLDAAGSEVGRRREGARAALELAQGPEDLPAPLVRKHVTWMNDAEQRAEAAGEMDGPHAVKRHLDVTSKDLDARLDQEPLIAHATAFRSAEALVMAEMRARRSLEQEDPKDAPTRVQSDRVRRSLPLADMLGDRWRDHVVGRTRAPNGTAETRFPDSTTIFVLWVRRPDGEWQVQTCYPRVPKKKE